MKHTPGPWAVMAIHPGAVAELRNEDGKMLCGRVLAICQFNEHINPNVNVTDKEEAFANADLIAAAPDLLEVCEALCEYGLGDEIPKQLLEAAYSAIAKAEPHEPDMSGPDGPEGDGPDGYRMTQADVEAEAEK